MRPSAAFGNNSLASLGRFVHTGRADEDNLLFGGASPVVDVKQSKALDAFRLNMSDAELLVAIAKLLENRRRNRMRKELRERLGVALSIPKRKWDELECLENSEVFITFKPGKREWRSQLNEGGSAPPPAQAGDRGRLRSGGNVRCRQGHGIVFGCYKSESNPATAPGAYHDSRRLASD
jgi:hypothetical protein